MSHYHMEIIMPPTARLTMEDVIAQVLAPFDENASPEIRSSGAQFWDWYVIGGRWSGEKIRQSMDDTKLEQFQEWMGSEKITVSEVQCGKPTLNPVEQREKVDAKWAEMFPESGFDVCPLFDHFPTSASDIMQLGQVDPKISMFRGMILVPGHDEQGYILETMLAQEIWNGATFQETAWDGTLEALLKYHSKYHDNYKSKYVARVTPKSDWLVVTVDYHS